MIRQWWLHFNLTVQKVYGPTLCHTKRIHLWVSALLSARLEWVALICEWWGVWPKATTNPCQLHTSLPHFGFASTWRAWNECYTYRELAWYTFIFLVKQLQSRAVRSSEFQFCTKVWNCISLYSISLGYVQEQSINSAV